MHRPHWRVFQLHVEDEWVEVFEPTVDELQAYHLFPRELTPRRRLEVAAYLDQVRLQVTTADRRFLKALRITAPVDFRSEA